MTYTNAKGIKFDVEHAMDFRDNGEMYKTGAVFAGLENANSPRWFESMDAAISEMEKWG